jgi:hypothetical protein
LRSGSLVVESEDWLFEQLLRVIEQDKNKFGLLEFVYFELVSCENMKKLASVSSDPLQLVNSAVWQRLCERLTLPIRHQEMYDVARKLRNRYPSEHHSCRPSFECQPDSPFQGIFAHLTSKCRGNPHDKGVIDVSSSPACSAHWAAKLCLDFNSRNQFCTTQQQVNAWICFDFKDMKVMATHYAIRSRVDQPGIFTHPQSWVIEVSDDKSSWDTVDEKVRNGDLNGAGRVKIFKVDTVKTGRYLRMRQTGPSHRGDYYLTFDSLELFGTLFGES